MALTVLSYIVLGTWLIQAAVGVALVVRMVRRGGRVKTVAVVHSALQGGALLLWFVFVLGAPTWLAWVAFVTITVGNSLGDWMLVQRWRAKTGMAGGFWSDYGKVVRGTFSGVLPKIVVFHAWFSGIVYFTCLAACILASM